MQLDELRSQLSECMDAKELVQKILELPVEKCVLVTCMLWRWWCRRNKINAREGSRPVEELETTIRYWAHESLLLCTNPKKQPGAKEAAVWQKPTGDTLKINVDGAFSAYERSGGWGFVVRDLYGDLMGSGAGMLQFVGSAIQAEATTCIEALHAAAQWGMMNVQVETDYQILVREL